MRKLRPYQLTLLLILAAISIGVLFFAALQDRMTDFAVFHKAGQRFLNAEPLYQESDGHYQFKYLPGSAVIFVPLALLPLVAAKLIWLFVILIAVLVIGISARRLCGAERASPGLIILTFLIVARFFVREIDLGQTNAVMTALVMLALVSLQSGRSFRAGMLLGIAAILKPYAVIFLPLLLVRRQLLPTAIALAVLALGITVPALFYGWNGNFELLSQWQTAAAASTPSLLTNPDNVSLFACGAKWFGLQDTYLILILPVVVMLLVFAALLYSGRLVHRRGSAHYAQAPEPSDAFTIEGAILLILIPLVSPQGWEYVLLTATLGILLLLTRRQMLPQVLRWPLYALLAVVPLSLYDILGKSLYYQFMGLSLLTPIFLYLLLCLFWIRLQSSP